MALAFDSNVEGFSAVPTFWGDFYIIESNASTGCYIPNQLVNSIYRNSGSHICFTQGLQKGVIVNF